MHLCCCPAPRSCWVAGEQTLVQRQEPLSLSWQLTWGTEAPHSWTCPNTGSTLPDWAGTDEGTILNPPESAEVKVTVSENGKVSNYSETFLLTSANMNVRFVLSAKYIFKKQKKKT